MSGRIVKDVLDYAPESLSESERWVLVALAEDARERDRIACYSSTEALARRTRRSEGTVRNSLSSLTAKGLIRPLLKAHRGKVQHYEIARLASHHRFVTYADNGSTQSPEKRNRAAKKANLRVVRDPPPEDDPAARKRHAQR